MHAADIDIYCQWQWHIGTFCHG